MYKRLIHGCGSAAAIILGVVTLLVCYDVIARNFGARSLPWIVEVTEYALPLATFLAAPWLMYRNEHIRPISSAPRCPRPAWRSSIASRQRSGSPSARSSPGTAWR
jgi:TRAP-type C4-dicarboxylate transport system permease small subunit